MTTFKFPSQGGGTRDLATADATSLSETTQNNGLQVGFPGEWAVTHAPGANVVATISKAAGGAGVRHVCTGIYAKIIGGTTAPAAISRTVTVRDGASGAGTVLHQFTMVIAAAIASKDEVNISGLNIIGSANTAMTVEFDVAGGVNTFECVSLRGYSVS